MNSKIKLILSEFKEAIRKISSDNLERILLFGSHGRNEAKAGSDIDIAIVLKSEPCFKEKMGIRNVSNNLSLKYDVVISEFLFSQEEYQKYRTPFLINIKKKVVSV
ncbi:MAG: nucleotidyltransferase domain-containing protein [bacterium]|nr:nucleotidyltransferase domain-containing protein [bacterium]